MIAKIMQIVLEFIFPSLKHKRLLKEALKREMMTEILFRMEKNMMAEITRERKSWKLSAQELETLEQIINNISDDDFAWYRFEIPMQNHHNANLVNLLKAIKGNFDEIDRNLQQDAYETLIEISPAFAKRDNELNAEILLSEISL